jgi:hydrogenase-4 component B
LASHVKSLLRRERRHSGGNGRVSLLLAASGRSGPAGLAWTVCLLHLAGHCLAKGTLFLTADGGYSVTDTYLIRQTGFLRNAPVIFGVGALFAAMSLAALPPQAWFCE